MQNEELEKDAQELAQKYGLQMVTVHRFTKEDEDLKTESLIMTAASDELLKAYNIAVVEGFLFDLLEDNGCTKGIDIINKIMLHAHNRKHGNGKWVRHTGTVPH